MDAWRLEYAQLGILFREVEGERAKRALMKTRSMKCAKVLQTATSTTKLPHPIRLARSFRSSFKMPLASLGAGFESFMLLLFNNLLRDSIYGMVMRVSIGAFLSLLDAGTDMYVLISYYSAGLYAQANILLAMIMANLTAQIIIVLGGE